MLICKSGRLADIGAIGEMAALTLDSNGFDGIDVKAENDMSGECDTSVLALFLGLVIIAILSCSYG